MSELGMYDHLNTDDPPNIPCTMPQLVSLIIKMNYGQHRFLSELVRQREASNKGILYLYPQYHKFTIMLRSLLEEEGSHV